MKSYLGVLRHPSFRYLFLGQSASAIGDRAVTVALALFITQRTGSPTDLGLVLGAQTVPLVALLLFGGVWADRLPRHRIMIFTDLTRAALHGLLAALIFAGTVRIWEIVVIEAGFGAAQAFFQPAYSGLLPQTVPENLIQDARALTESMANLAFLVGPALATAVVLGIGAGEAFAFDAATFIISALLLLRVHPRARGESPRARGESPRARGESPRAGGESPHAGGESPRARGESPRAGGESPRAGGESPRAGGESPPRASMVHELRAGWREVRSRTWVWVTILVFTGAVMTVYAQWYALAPVIARDVYGGAGIFGLLESVAGVGAVCGAIAGLGWRPQRPLFAGMLLVLAWPVQDGLFALGAPLEVVVVSAFGTGFGFSLLMIWWETALAHHIPPGALSRVSAWDWMGSLALLPVGFLVAGPLAHAFGARTVLGVGSVIGLALLALGVAPRSVRELRDPGSAEERSREIRVEARSEA